MHAWWYDLHLWVLLCSIPRHSSALFAPRIGIAIMCLRHSLVCAPGTQGHVPLPCGAYCVLCLPCGFSRSSDSSDSCRWLPPVQRLWNCCKLVNLDLTWQGHPAAFVPRFCAVGSRATLFPMAGPASAPTWCWLAVIEFCLPSITVLDVVTTLSRHHRCAFEAHWTAIHNLHRDLRIVALRARRLAAVLPKRYVYGVPAAGDLHPLLTLGATYQLSGTALEIAVCSLPVVFSQALPPLSVPTDSLAWTFVMLAMNWCGCLFWGQAFPAFFNWVLENVGRQPVSLYMVVAATFATPELGWWEVDFDVSNPLDFPDFEPNYPTPVVWNAGDALDARNAWPLPL